MGETDTHWHARAHSTGSSWWAGWFHPVPSEERTDEVQCTLLWLCRNTPRGSVALSSFVVQPELWSAHSRPLQTRQETSVRRWISVCHYYTCISLQKHSWMINRVTIHTAHHITSHHIRCNSGAHLRQLLWYKKHFYSFCVFVYKKTEHFQYSLFTNN